MVRNLFLHTFSTFLTLSAGRSELLRLTRHVELMVQVENLFRSRLLPQAVQRLLLRSITVIHTGEKPTVSVHPNSSRGIVDSLFLFLSRTLGTRRLLIKIFEMVSSGFIAPEPEPSLPRQLINAVLDVALFEHELDKRERLLYLRNQLSVPGQHQHQHHHRPGPPPPTPASHVTVTRKTSAIRPSTLARASWRLTYMSDVDADDDPPDYLAGAPQAACPPLWTAPQRVLPDPNARLEELKSLVLHLQTTVLELSRQVQENIPPTQHRDATSTAAPSLEAVNEVIV